MSLVNIHSHTRVRSPAVAGCTRRRRLQTFVVAADADLGRSDVLDLLDRLLVYDPAARPTARECMAHPFFADSDVSPPCLRGQ